MKRRLWMFLTVSLLGCGGGNPVTPGVCREQTFVGVVGSTDVFAAAMTPVGELSTTGPLSAVPGPEAGDISVQCFAPGTGTISYTGPADCTRVEIEVVCMGEAVCELVADPNELTIEIGPDGVSGVGTFVVTGTPAPGAAPPTNVNWMHTPGLAIAFEQADDSMWLASVTCLGPSAEESVSIVEVAGRCGARVPVRCVQATTSACLAQGLYETTVSWGGGGCAHPFTQEIVLVHAGSYEGVEIGGFDSPLVFDEGTCTFSGDVGGDTLELTCHGTSCTARLRNGADGCTYEATPTLANHEGNYRHVGVPPCGGGTRLGTGTFTEIEAVPGDPTQFAILSGNNIELRAVGAPGSVTLSFPIPAEAISPAGLVGQVGPSFLVSDAPSRARSAFLVYQDFGALAFEADASSTALQVLEPGDSSPPHVAAISSDGLRIHAIRDTGSEEILFAPSTEWDPGDPSLHVGVLGANRWWVLTDGPTRGWVVSASGEVAAPATLPDLGDLVDVASAHDHVYALFDDGSASSVLDWAPETGHVARFVDYSSPGTSVEVVGNTLLVGNGRRVSIDDISAPFRPIPVGQVIGPVNPIDVTRVGDQLLVVDGAQLGGATLGCSLPAD